MSNDFPTQNSYQPDNSGRADAFVAKLSADGTELVYSTYLGGSDHDYGRSIAVDSEGCAYVTGMTESDSFPTTDEAYQEDYAGAYDAFVAKLSADGTDLVYSTYLGGSSSDYGEGIAVDSEGCAYVTGDTRSTDFPTRDHFQESISGPQDAFVAKLSADGTDLVYSTYLGGSDWDAGQDLAVDSDGCAYVIGYTWSDDFPTRNSCQDTHIGQCDVFVAKIDTTRSGDDSLVYSTYLGGSDEDYGWGIAVDLVGCAYVTGQTASADFPTHNPIQDHNDGSIDAFVAKIDTTESGDASLVYSTYLGGSSTDHGWGIAVDSAGCAYVTGETGSGDFPSQNPIQENKAGGRDAFVAKLSADGTALVYSTYLGGSDGDYGYGIAVDSEGCAYVTGATDSDNFPTLNPLQENNVGERDAFVTKLCLEIKDDEPPIPPVGGTGYLVNGLALLAPWIALAAVMAGALIFMKRRQSQSSA